ncbi:hypothetical protein LXG23DRAFT_50544 [Yarrowia lipolytica]|jgi:hypothetical protein|uniref:Y.lipolytica saccharopine dehydrogenase (LYS5) protein n=1 Tax=Yarrowia lipolytica TaxID=4952 RepID=A2N9G2_YARLL|nr:hypothetical protein (LYS5 region) - yeast (Yarrowia lipolytica) (strain W29) [Yarrowia lipolytica]AAA35247.1 ORF1 [Yarrowia lipolytica]KAJ8052541.1 hypothetical protein LXG23DRAFT_50544 [Yarrowia lipolytica]
MKLLANSQNVFVEQSLSSGPDRSSVSLRKLQERRQQSLRKGLGSLSRQKRGQVVDRAHGQLGASSGLNRHGGMVERGSNCVHGDRVVGVGGVSRDVDNDTELSGLLVEQIVVDERRNGLRQVDAVDEDIRVSNLLEGSTLLGLVHVPSNDVLFGDTDLSGQINGTGSTSAKSTNHQDGRELGALLNSSGKILLNLVDKLGLIGIGRDTGQVFAVGVGLLEGPSLDTDGGTGESSVEAKGGNSSSIVILQELKVVQSSVSCGESAQNVLPSALILVAVSKLDVLVRQRERFLRQLLKTNNHSVLGGRDPRALLDKSGSDIDKLLVVEDSKGRLLHKDLESSIKQLSGGSRRESRSVLERLGLGSEMELHWCGHCVCVVVCGEVTMDGVSYQAGEQLCLSMLQLSKSHRSTKIKFAIRVGERDGGWKN